MFILIHDKNLATRKKKKKENKQDSKQRMAKYNSQIGQKNADNLNAAARPFNRMQIPQQVIQWDCDTI